MKPRDKLLFYKYLDAATHYLEYGSGGSTVQASLRPGLRTLVSVESDPDWYATVTRLVTASPLRSDRLLHIEMDTQPNTWGFPGRASGLDDWVAYSRVIRTLDHARPLDLVLIDGRFRVACCLHCYDCVSDDCRIVFDDFLDRPQYRVVLDFYEIVEKTEDKTLVVLKKKPGASPPAALISHYEAVAN